METALQELLKYVNGMPNQQVYAEEINCIKERIKQLLSKEREQMKKARENGFVNGVSHERHNYVIQDFEQYYETNFNTSKV
jgi:hypothetical protein